MKRTAMILFSLIVLLSQSAALLAADAPASKPAATPTEAAKQYIEFYKARTPSKVVDAFWDLPTLFDAMFGKERMAKVSNVDRAEMQKSMRKFFEMINSNKELVEWMATATYSDFAERKLDGDRIAVDFKVTQKDDVISNSLVFVKKNGAFRVVDAATKGTFLAKALAAEYKAKEEKMTPLQYLKVIFNQE